jgi:hypothetical protein
MYEMDDEMICEVLGIEMKKWLRLSNGPAEVLYEEFGQDLRAHVRHEIGCTLIDYDLSDEMLGVKCSHIYRKTYPEGDYRSLCKFILIVSILMEQQKAQFKKA